MKHTCNIIWVYGSSASGKETFIRKIINGYQLEILDYVKWGNNHIIPIWESMKYIGQDSDDPIINKRKKIIQAVKKAAEHKNGIILIKGQDADLKSNLPGILKRTLSGADHMIIFLHVDNRELLKRWRRKSWWKNEYTINTVRSWLKYQIDLLLKLHGFKIIALDANNHYQLINFPPDIEQKNKNTYSKIFLKLHNLYQTIAMEVIMQKA